MYDLQVQFPGRVGPIRDLTVSTGFVGLIGHFCYGGQGMALRTLYYVFHVHTFMGFVG